MTRHISCGPVDLLYENGFVRYIKAGSSEIVRLIYFALRDSSWVTAELKIDSEEISVEQSGFRIAYRAINIANEIPVIEWSVLITGNDSGTVDFSIDGKVLSEYTRNRAGICVLHPILETVGRPVHVTKADGSAYDSEFPKVIQPHQPFLDITKFDWTLENGIEASLSYEGDVFETEDQRNWSDTSFKTYSTPLSLPMPVVLKPGDRVKQRVLLNLRNATAKFASEKVVRVQINRDKVTPFPKIGVSFPGGKTISKQSAELLEVLKPDHLRVVVNFSDQHWKGNFRNGLHEATILHTNVFLHLIFDGNATTEFSELLSEIGKSNISSITRVAVSPLDRKRKLGELIKLVVPKIKETFPKADVGAGYRSYFTELNRNRFDTSEVDFVVYALNPQVHATDDRTMIDNLAAQSDQVQSAKLLAPGKNVHVGMVSLRPPFNPDATSVGKDSGKGLPFRHDVRQTSKMAACWALSSIKYLAEGGAESITLFESHGMNGYLLDEVDSVHPEFPNVKLFPVYDAISKLRSLNPETVVYSLSSEPLIISSLVVRSNHHTHLVLINHTSEKQEVVVNETRFEVGPEAFVVSEFSF